MARPDPLLPCKGGFLGHQQPAGGGWELRRALPAAESGESGLCRSWQPLLCLTSNAPVGPEHRTRLPASAAAAAMPYLARRAIASLLPARSKVVNKQLGLCSLSPAQGRPRPLDCTAGSKRGLEAEEPPRGDLPAFKSCGLGVHPWFLPIPRWVHSSHLPAWGSRGGSQERAESITSGWASSGDGAARTLLAREGAKAELEPELELPLRQLKNKPAPTPQESARACSFPPASDLASSPARSVASR